MMKDRQLLEIEGEDYYLQTADDELSDYTEADDDVIFIFTILIILTI